MIETYAFPSYNQPNTPAKIYQRLFNYIDRNFEYIGDSTQLIDQPTNSARLRSVTTNQSHTRYTRGNPIHPSNPNRHHIRHLLRNFLTNLYTCCRSWRWCVANMQRIDARDNAEVIYHISV